MTSGPPKCKQNGQRKARIVDTKTQEQIVSKRSRMQKAVTGLRPQNPKYAESSGGNFSSRQMGFKMVICWECGQWSALQGQPPWSVSAKVVNPRPPRRCPCTLVCPTSGKAEIAVIVTCVIGVTISTAMHTPRKTELGHQLCKLKTIQQGGTVMLAIYLLTDGAESTSTTPVSQFPPNLCLSYK